MGPGIAPGFNKFTASPRGKPASQTPPYPILAAHSGRPSGPQTSSPASEAFTAIS